MMVFIGFFEPGVLVFGQSSPRLALLNQCAGCQVVEQGDLQADRHGFFSSGVMNVTVNFTQPEGSEFTPGGGIAHIHVHQPGTVRR